MSAESITQRAWAVDGREAPLDGRVELLDEIQTETGGSALATWCRSFTGGDAVHIQIWTPELNRVQCSCGDFTYNHPGSDKYKITSNSDLHHCKHIRAAFQQVPIVAEAAYYALLDALDAWYERQARRLQS